LSERFGQNNLFDIAAAIGIGIIESFARKYIVETCRSCFVSVVDEFGLREVECAYIRGDIRIVAEEVEVVVIELAYDFEFFNVLVFLGKLLVFFDSNRTGRSGRSMHNRDRDVVLLRAR